MNACPYCGVELPGTERLCRDCWEKRCAAQSSRDGWKPFLQNLFIVATLMAAALLAMRELPSLIPAWALVRLSALSANFDAMESATILSLSLVLTGFVVAVGFWDSLQALRARTWHIPLLWMIYVPSFVGLLFWKVIGDASFRTSALIGALLIAAFRFTRRFVDWYSS